MNVNDQIKQLQLEFKLIWHGRKMFLLALVLIMGSLLFGYYVTYAEYDKISPNQDDLEIANDNLELAQGRQAAWNKALADPMFATMSAVLDNVLFSRKPMLEIIYALSGSSAEGNIRLTRFEFSPGDISTPSGQTRTTNNRQPSLSIDLTFTAPFAQLMDYLIAIEQLQPIGSIATMQLGKNQNGPSSARVIYRTFYDESTITGSSVANLPQLTPTDRLNLEAVSHYRPIKDSDLEQAELILGDKMTLLD
ncbi:hypothetical protein FWH30_01925 [Microgenomates group bacterium]|nr:hypothetical protein [Microgenomates group bacterium]